LRETQNLSVQSRDEPWVCGIPRKIGARKTLASYPPWVGILVFGSIWGFLQCIAILVMISLGLIPWLKSHLFMCPCPLIAAIFGFPIMAMALRIYKKPAMLVGMGALAACFSFLVIPFLRVPAFTTPITTYPIVNPALANLFAALAFSLVVSLVGKRIATMSIPTLVGVGALSMFLSQIIWIHTVVAIGAPILGTLAGGISLVEYIATGAMILTAMSAATLPAGYVAGSRLQLGVDHLIKVKPLLYRVGPIAVLVICWGASVMAVAAGL